MPDKNAHRRQVQHNQEFIDFLNLDSTKYLDWVVTVAFHVAIHLVEQHLAQYGIDSPNHADRWLYMERCKSLKPVYQDTRWLYDQSRDCRYQCWIPDKRFVKAEVLPTLGSIETTLKNLRPSP